MGDGGWKRLSRLPDSQALAPDDPRPLTHKERRRRGKAPLSSSDDMQRESRRESPLSDMQHESPSENIEQSWMMRAGAAPRTNAPAESSREMPTL
eukprot:5666041-Pyramimonas_sp.AAC.1